MLYSLKNNEFICTVSITLVELISHSSFVCVLSSVKCAGPQISVHFLSLPVKNYGYTLFLSKESPFLAPVETTLASRFSPPPDMCRISLTIFVKSREKKRVCCLQFFFFFFLIDWYFCFTAQQLGKIQHIMYVYQSPYIYCKD